MAEQNVNEENNEHITNNEHEQSLERKKHVDALLSDLEAGRQRACGKRNNT